MSLQVQHTNIKHHDGNIITYTIENHFRLENNNNPKIRAAFPQDYEWGGWGNGYIAVPMDHKYFGLDYSSLPIDLPTLKSGHMHLFILLRIKREYLSNIRYLDLIVCILVRV